MFKRTFTIMIFFLLACSCRTGVEIPGAPSPDVSQLEERVYDMAPDGEQALIVRPNINSRDDLLRYREMKIAEVAEILDLTEDASGERPYLPVVITMARPVTIAELNDIISRYDPSVEKAIGSAGFERSACLGKAVLAKGVDGLLPAAIRFNSTTGRGQLHYETMANVDELSEIEEALAAREEEMNGISDFELVKGITSVIGGIHRDDALSVYDDPRVFLADLGPLDLYRGEVVHAFWDDVSDFVERYLNH